MAHQRGREHLAPIFQSLEAAHLDERVGIPADESDVAKGDEQARQRAGARAKNFQLARIVWRAQRRSPAQYQNQILKKLNSRELAWIKQSNLVIIVTGSSYKKELLKHRVCSSRVKVVNPGQESYPFKTIKVGESKKILYPIKGISVGTISPRKNQILLVDMLSKINPKLYRWTFIGNKQLFPEYTKKVMNMANKGNWKASLFFVGQVHHSKVLMSLTDSDLFVSTSVKESYGMSVAEACSVGLPVLSFNTGDFSSWVKHNQNGYLIDQDDIRGMQNKLNDVISDLSILTGLKDVAKKNSSGIHFPTWEESSTKLEKKIGRASCRERV